MKKLLYLLILPLLSLTFACGDDDDPTDIYIDNSLIEGAWYRISASDSLVNEFNYDIHKRKIIDKYTLTESSSRNYGEYKLTKDKILYTDNSFRYYRLDTDSLFIKEGSSTYSKYVRVK